MIQTGSRPGLLFGLGVGLGLSVSSLHSQVPGGVPERSILTSSARPGNSWDDPIQTPRDLTGRSPKWRKIPLKRGRDRREPGSSRFLIHQDPWLAYQIGKDLLLREYSLGEGAFSQAGKLGGPRLEDGATKILTRGTAGSCGTCHNVPYQTLGAGITIAKNGGRGRNTPHLFGAGLVEMLGETLRSQLLAQADRDQNGWISLAEARVAGPARVVPVPGAPALDFGSFQDRDQDGRPDLNPIVSVWLVDAQGARIPTARHLRTRHVAGFNLEVQVFGHGHHPKQALRHRPLPPTLRAFTTQAFDVHTGLTAHDPEGSLDPDQDGLAPRTPAGALQFANHPASDRGRLVDPLGESRDDPDRDGVLVELTAGDLDLAEWHLLNHPRPGTGPQGPRERYGKGLMGRFGCTNCHTPDWKIPAPGEVRGAPGDRRFFDLTANWDPKTQRLQGRFRRLPWVQAKTPRPGFRVEGIYSDFRSHDLGPGFQETQYDGSQIRVHRTPPLWGVGSSAPYGHDGASLTLEAVILRHGGEARDSREAYVRASRLAQESLRAFLESLILYDPRELPVDLDQDGEISDHFLVAGKDTGEERFHPEWLFQTPGEIEGWTRAPDGSRVFSFALVNFSEAYRLEDFSPR